MLPLLLPRSPKSSACAAACWSLDSSTRSCLRSIRVPADCLSSPAARLSTPAACLSSPAVCLSSPAQGCAARAAREAVTTDMASLRMLLRHCAAPPRTLSAPSAFYSNVAFNAAWKRSSSYATSNAALRGAPLHTGWTSASNAALRGVAFASHASNTASVAADAATAVSAPAASQARPIVGRPADINRSASHKAANQDAVAAQGAPMARARARLAEVLATWPKDGTPVCSRSLD